MKADKPLYGYSSRIAVGLAAAGGLMCAACISGLPTATCKALAQLYGTAIGSFGAAGLSGLAILGGLAFPGRETERKHRTDSVLTIFFICLGFVAMLLGVVQSLFLRGIIDQCWH